MTTEELARGLLRQASLRLETVRRAVASADWAYAVRSAQECVELALKAALFAAGVEPPKWHDVGLNLVEHAARFPDWPEPILHELAFISRSLRGDRERSMYGDEDLAEPPDALYSEYDARRAEAWASRVFELVCEYIGE